MTQHKKSVEKQKRRLAKEKADNNIVLHYFQRGAGSHYSLVRYESGKEVITKYPND